MSRPRLLFLISLLPAIAWIVPAALPHFPSQVVVSVPTLLIGCTITALLWLIALTVYVVRRLGRSEILPDPDIRTPVQPSRYRSGY